MGSGTGRSLTLGSSENSDRGLAGASPTSCGGPAASRRASRPGRGARPRARARTPRARFAPPCGRRRFATRRDRSPPSRLARRWWTTASRSRRPASSCAPWSCLSGRRAGLPNRARDGSRRRGRDLCPAARPRPPPRTTPAFPRCCGSRSRVALRRRRENRRPRASRRWREGASWSPPIARGSRRSAERPDVYRLGALVACLCVVLDLRTLGERLEAVAGDAGVMHEEVLAELVRRYEAEALLVAEPLHCSGGHFATSTVVACCVRGGCCSATGYGRWHWIVEPQPDWSFGPYHCLPVRIGRRVVSRRRPSARARRGR